jgi:hypothetical protein
MNLGFRRYCIFVIFIVGVDLFLGRFRLIFRDLLLLFLGYVTCIFHLVYTVEFMEHHQAKQVPDRCQNSI